MSETARTPTVAPVQALVIQIVLALGGFAIGTGEFVLMGLMPNVAADLGVTEPQVGHLISAYALGVVVGAPILAILGARFCHKYLLIALMAFYALGNLASAVAGHYGMLLGFRFIAGLPHGTYFGVAGLGGRLIGAGEPARQSGEPCHDRADARFAHRQPPGHGDGTESGVALRLCLCRPDRADYRHCRLSGGAGQPAGGAALADGGDPGVRAP